MKKIILLLLMLTACGDSEPGEQLLFVECYSYDLPVYGPTFVKEIRKTNLNEWELKTPNDNWVTVWGDCFVK